MYGNIYDEEYARLTLKYIFPYPIENFVCADKPDIQNETDGIGIEVTRAQNRVCLERDNYAQRLMGKKPTQKEIDRFGGKIYLDKDGIAFGYSSTKGLCDNSTYKDVAAALQKKKSKFDSYKSFKKMGLYCFIYLCIFHDDEIAEIAKIDTHPFDFVIINSTDLIYLIEGNSFKKFCFSEDQVENFKKTAKLIGNNGSR